MEPQQITRMLRRRGWRVICWALALGAVVGAASYFLQNPVYEAGAQVFLQSGSSSQSLSPQPASPVDAATFAESQAILIRSIGVARVASERLPGHPSPPALLSRIRVVANPTGS